MKTDIEKLAEELAPKAFEHGRRVARRLWLAGNNSRKGYSGKWNDLPEAGRAGHIAIAAYILLRAKQLKRKTKP